MSATGDPCRVRFDQRLPFGIFRPSIDPPPLVSPFRELRALGITIIRLPGKYCVNSEGTRQRASLNVAHGFVDEGQRSAEA